MPLKPSGQVGPKAKPVTANRYQAIAMFELTLDNGDVKVVSERHYELVGAANISLSELRSYSERATD